MAKVMIGCRVEGDVKSKLESTATLLGVTESKIVHDAVMKYLCIAQEKTPLSRIEELEKTIEELAQKYDRLSRAVFVSNANCRS